MLSRIRGAAIVAAVAAILAVLVVPAVRLTAPIVCGKDARMEYRYVHYTRNGSRTSSLEVSCVEHAGGASRDALLPAVATLFGIYFAVLFPVLLLLWAPARHPRHVGRARGDMAGGG